MSAYSSRRHAKSVSAPTHEHSLQVSDHAAQRWLERIGADPYPRQRVREAFHDAEREVSLPGFENPARLDDRGRAVVFDSDDRVAITVIEPSPDQLKAAGVPDPEPDASAGWREEARYQGVQPEGHR